MIRLRFILSPRSFVAALMLFGSNALAVPVSQADIEFFEAKIRPLLSEHCYECHSEAKRKGNLLLDSRQGWVIGGDSGPAIVPGNPDESLVVKAVEYLDTDLQMPPKNRLRPEEIADLRRWIEQGAVDPREGEVKTVEGFDVEARKAAHWAWHPPVAPALPEVKDPSWPRSEIDAFILRRLEDADLKPASEAEKRVLLRRVTFDLTGLPPTVEQIDAFLANHAEDAFEQVVDELLRSPRFGEHWAQHWLDLMRYAETRGHEQDFPIPMAWRYRDYVIRAFNADLPYDQFVMEHLAGDLLPQPRIDPERRTNESIQGTGFWHLGEATHSPVDISGDEAARVANQIDVFSKAFQGLTVSCARCHDHKSDAIPTKDYYALYGYLQSSNYQLADIADPEAQQMAVRDLETLNRETTGALIEAIADGYQENQSRLAHILQAASTKQSEKSHPSGTSTELEKWVAKLQTAASQPDHPFFVVATSEDPVAVWTQLARETAEKAVLQTVVRTEEPGELNLIAVERRFDATQDVIIDYSQAASDQWFTSGERFGDGVARKGTIVFGDSPTQPIRHLVAEPAAFSDLASAKLSGLLRTPTFEVTADTVWFRFRGSAQVFIEVDSHRVCEGPLHSSALKLDLKGGPDFQWASHDMQRYLGHRVHVEFTPSDDFALSRLQFGKEAPVEVFEPNLRLIDSLDEVGNSPETRIEQFTQWIGESLMAFAEGKELDRSELRLLSDLLSDSDLIELITTPRLHDLITAFSDRRQIIENTLPEPIYALAMMDGSGENEPVHIRGNHRSLSEERVPRSFLTALGGQEIPPPSAGSGRLEFAQQVASPENPLTSRVMVNRLWHHLFGRGIVETVDNFGVSGQPPTHPELLNYLSLRFIEKEWSVKRMIREMVLSSTYRMASMPEPTVEARDPKNLLWHRMPIRRLNGEAIRDHLLATSGRLNLTSFGPSVPVHISEFMKSNRSPGHSGPLDGDGRRSIYLEARRNHMDPMLIAFDKPTPFTAIGQRNVSNSPAQPLILLNNPLVHELASSWADRLLADSSLSDEQRLELAYLTAFARTPTSWEIETALNFLADSTDDRHQAWSDLTHTLFNVKEFIFIN